MPGEIVVQTKSKVTSTLRLWVLENRHPWAVFRESFVTALKTMTLEDDEWINPTKEK